MTGGGTSDSLQSLEARGLGEGWSDAVAEYIHTFIQVQPGLLIIQINLVGHSKPPLLYKSSHPVYG